MALIADVFEVVLLDANGEAFGSTTLTNANIEVSVTANDVRGGRGNQLIGVLHTDRDINISLTDVEFKYDWLAKQLGQDIVTGAGVAYAMPKWYTAVDNVGSIEITLDETPDSTESLKIYDAAGKLIADTNYTLATNTVTFTTGVSAGDRVEVRTYTYATDAATEAIDVDNSVFPKGVTTVLETLEINSEEVATHRLQYQFLNALPTGNFSVSTSSEKTASTQEFSLRVVKPQTSDVVGKVLRIPVA